jgi:hypothetical protein
MHKHCIPLVLLTLLTACAQFPALDEGVSEADRNAPYPTLIPLAPLIAQADALGGSVSNIGFDGRIATLNARAAALRGGIIDPATRARMRAGVDTSALQ